MPASRPARLFLGWLVLCAVLAAALLGAGRYGLREAVAAEVGQFLQLALDESFFSSAENRANDAPALQRLARQINADLAQVAVGGPLAPWRDCAVRLVGVDGVVTTSALPPDESDGAGTVSGERAPIAPAADPAATGAPAARTQAPGSPAAVTPAASTAGAESAAALPWRIAFTLPRNDIDREIVLALGCEMNGASLAAVLGAFTALFVAVVLLVPPPLSARHREWINYLRGLGYDGQRAFDIVRGFDPARLDLGEAQRRALERLHDPLAGNAAAAFGIVTDPRVAALSPSQMDWLVLGLARTPGDLDAALGLATAGDALRIDLAAMRLSVRGLAVPLSGTPFFYYAWYAMRRREGDGWITNPASNRPDREEGQRLADFMARHGGHARAINDLEQAGLKARTLDQNRSKIKDELVGALGEDLAEPYLFETSRHPDGLHTRYRLRLDANCITFSGALGELPSA